MISLKQILTELSFADLFKISTRSRIDRAKGVHGGSLDIQAGKDGEMYWYFKFRHNPIDGGSGHQHHGYIKFTDYENDSQHKKDPDDMECNVECDCEDFLYRWAYANNKKGVSPVGPTSLSKNNGQPAKFLNPNNQPGMCIHLLALRNFLNKHIDWEGLKHKAYQRKNNPIGFDPKNRPPRRSSVSTNIKNQKPNIFEDSVNDDSYEKYKTEMDKLVTIANGKRINMDEFLNESMDSQNIDKELIKEGRFYNGRGWFIHEGESDKISAIFENGNKLWFDLDYADKIHPEDRSKWREKACRTWSNIARNIKNNPDLNENGNTIEKTWEECFMEALEDPKLKEFKKRNFSKIFPGNHLTTRL